MRAIVFVWFFTVSSPLLHSAGYIEGAPYILMIKETKDEENNWVGKDREMESEEDENTKKKKKK